MPNLFDNLQESSPDELIETLVSNPQVRIERIVSTGQATPPGQWYDQSEHEWVVLLAGGAKILFEGSAAALEMKPGDWINIPAHQRHRVERTDPAQATVWLAVHYT